MQPRAVDYTDFKCNDYGEVTLLIKSLLIAGLLTLHYAFNRIASHSAKHEAACFGCIRSGNSQSVRRPQRRRNIIYYAT